MHEKAVDGANRLQYLDLAGTVDIRGSKKVGQTPVHQADSYEKAAPSRLSMPTPSPSPAHSPRATLAPYDLAASDLSQRPKGHLADAGATLNEHVTATIKDTLRWSMDHWWAQGCKLDEGNQGNCPNLGGFHLHTASDEKVEMVCPRFWVWRGIYGTMTALQATLKRGAMEIGSADETRFSYSNAENLASSVRDEANKCLSVLRLAEQAQLQTHHGLSTDSEPLLAIVQRLATLAALQQSWQPSYGQVRDVMEKAPILFNRWLTEQERAFA